MPDTNANPSAPTGTPVWVWIGVVVVLALVVAGGGWWWMHGAHKTSVAAKRPNLLGMMGDTVTALDTAMPDRDKMCSATLARALDFGVLPPGATLVSQDAQEAQPEGRYTCQAQGAEGKYTLGIDTSCPNSQEKTCFALDSVTGDNGAVLYQRRNS
jgi:hypothetical protein